VIDVVTRVRAGIVCLVYEVTGLRAGRSRNRDSIRGRDKLFISSPNCLYRSLGQRSSVLNGYLWQLTAYLC